MKNIQAKLGVFLMYIKNFIHFLQGLGKIYIENVIEY